MINFATLQALDIPEGKVVDIKDAAGRVIWAVGGGKVILEVEKITSDTYAGETTYTGEQFILLDIYPKTNGTVKVTYGGLTKTITDTSGVAEPNAQQVFFGTFNGVSDSVTTPASGELTIEGDYVAFAYGSYAKSKTMKDCCCTCVTKILNFGATEYIPDSAFLQSILIGDGLSGELVIPSTIKSIGNNAFLHCRGLSNVIVENGVVSIGYGAFAMVIGPTHPVASLQAVTMLSKIPPTLMMPDESYYGAFDVVEYDGSGNKVATTALTIIVPQGCGAIYKATEGWSTYADYIVEAT
jgi:hypothetical protein